MTDRPPPSQAISQSLSVCERLDRRLRDCMSSWCEQTVRSITEITQTLRSAQLALGDVLKSEVTQVIFVSVLTVDLTDYPLPPTDVILGMLLWMIEQG